MWVTSRTGSVGWGFLGFEKSSELSSCLRTRESGFRAGARPDECGALRAPRVGWVEGWRCKSSQHRKSVSLSPHVEKPWNSKRWIRISYLNQFREFRVFGFFYMFMNNYERFFRIVEPVNVTYISLITLNYVIKLIASIFHFPGKLNRLLELQSQLLK